MPWWSSSQLLPAARSRSPGAAHIIGPGALPGTGIGPERPQAWGFVAWDPWARSPAGGRRLLGPTFVGGVAAAALRKLMTSDFELRRGERSNGVVGRELLGRHGQCRGCIRLRGPRDMPAGARCHLVTGRAAAPGFAGPAIGLVLIAIHLVGIPLDGTSVNPAPVAGPGSVRRRRRAAPALALYRRAAARCCVRRTDIADLRPTE